MQLYMCTWIVNMPLPVGITPTTGWLVVEVSCDDQAAVPIEHAQIEIGAIAVADADDLILVADMHFRRDVPGSAPAQAAAERLADQLEALLRRVRPAPAAAAP